MEHAPLFGRHIEQREPGSCKTGTRKIQTNRDHKFDNLKGVMIFLVVFCHFIEKLYSTWEDDSITRYLYFFIYLFHMPVFVFISGFFSKPKNGEDASGKIFSTCLIPYLLFQFIYSVLLPKVGLWSSLFSFAYPRWTLWYFLSLFFWKLLVKPVSTLRWPLMIAILTALYVGFTDFEDFLALSRTLCFFPYFLAGYLLPEEYIEKIRNRKVIFAGAAALIAVIALFVLQKFNVSINALYMSTPYKGMSGIAAVGVRLLLFAAGFVCIGGLIAVIPDQRGIVSLIGRNSVVIYIVHAGIIRILQKILEIQMANGLLCIGFAAVFSVSVCLLFGSEPIAKAYRFIIGQIAGFVVKKKSPDAQQIK